MAHGVPFVGHCDCVGLNLIVILGGTLWGVVQGRVSAWPCVVGLCKASVLGKAGLQNMRHTCARVEGRRVLG